VGYLVAQAHADRKRSEYVCWDEAPESAAGGGVDQNQGGLYPVEVQCGTLPCAKFIDGHEMACVVCSIW